MRQCSRTYADLIYPTTPGAGTGGFCGPQLSDDRRHRPLEVGRAFVRNFVRRLTSVTCMPGPVIMTTLAEVATFHNRRETNDPTDRKVRAGSAGPVGTGRLSHVLPHLITNETEKMCM